MVICLLHENALGYSVSVLKWVKLIGTVAFISVAVDFVSIYWKNLLNH